MLIFYQALFIFHTVLWAGTPSLSSITSPMPEQFSPHQTPPRSTKILDDSLSIKSRTHQLGKRSSLYIISLSKSSSTLANPRGPLARQERSNTQGQDTRQSCLHNMIIWSLHHMAYDFTFSHFGAEFQSLEKNCCYFYPQKVSTKFCLEERRIVKDCDHRLSYLIWIFNGWSTLKTALGGCPTASKPSYPLSC